MKTLLGLLAATVVFGQAGPPSVTNGRVETRAFSGNLASQLSVSQATWIGYAIKTRRGDHGDCCWDGGNCHSSSANPIQLEGSDTIALLFRVDSNRIERIRAYPLACSLDTGGLPFVWIAAVPAAQSVAVLRDLVHAESSQHIENQAVFALSLHDDPSALDALIALAKADPSAHVREQALFWLAQKAGARAVATIANAIENDPDTGVKKKAVFALSQLPHEEGVPKLIEIARTQRNPVVRKQAFFWLGQSKDPRALAFFEQVLAR